MNKQLFPALAVLLVLLLLLSVFANVRLIISSRAAGEGNYSAENSYLFASPLEAQANGEDKVRFTVFVLNSQGQGVPNQQVMLSKAPELITEQQNSLTDSYGRAVFDLASKVAGEYVVEAVIDGTKLGEALKIKFK
jgi:hypothetical protein